MSEAEFQKAAGEVKTLSYTPDNNAKLKLYGLFKQANSGDNDTPKPGMFEFEGKAKWEAWTKVKGTSKADAMKQYVAYVEELKSKQ